MLECFKLSKWTNIVYPILLTLTLTLTLTLSVSEINNSRMVLYLLEDALVCF